MSVRSVLQRGRVLLTVVAVPMSVTIWAHLGRGGEWLPVWFGQQQGGLLLPPVRCRCVSVADRLWWPTLLASAGDQAKQLHNCTIHSREVKQLSRTYSPLFNAHHITTAYRETCAHLGNHSSSSRGSWPHLRCQKSGTIADLVSGASWWLARGGSGEV